MVNVFEYLDYRIFLRDICAERKKDMPGFSYRWLSKRIGLRSSGFLSWVISGKRTISLSLALELARALKLNKAESDYFTALVQFTQADDPDEKDHFFEQLTAKKPVSVKTVRDDQHQYYSKWYYAAIRELIALCRIDDNYKRVAGLLNPPIRPLEVREALSLLDRLGLIRKNNCGWYEQTDKVITSSGARIDPALIRRYQSETIDLARSAIGRFSKEERDISTVTMSINGEALRKIRKLAEMFRAEVMSIARTCKDPDRIYQLNCQVFPLSEVKGDTE